MIDLIKKCMAPLQQRIMNMVSRGVIKSTNDDTKLQLAQLELMKGEVRDMIERFQEYGLTSRPLDGAEALTLFHSGNRDHGIIIAVEDRRYRLKGLEKGEVALYTDEGDSIHLKRGNEIVVTTSKLTVNAEAEVVINTADATVNATGSASVTAPEASITAATQATITSPLVNIDSAAVNVSGLLTAAAISSGTFSSTPDDGVVVTGDIAVTGNVSDANGSMQEMRGVYNGHSHTNHNIPPAAQMT